jgi:hypothetical protein
MPGSLEFETVKPGVALDFDPFDLQGIVGEPVGAFIGRDAKQKARLPGDSPDFLVSGTEGIGKTYNFSRQEFPEILHAARHFLFEIILR